MKSTHKFESIKAIGFDVDRTLFYSPPEWSKLVGRTVTD